MGFPVEGAAELCLSGNSGFHSLREKVYTVLGDAIIEKVPAGGTSKVSGSKAPTTAESTNSATPSDILWKRNMTSSPLSLRGTLGGEGLEGETV